MSFASGLQKDLYDTISNYGTIARVKYFNVSYTAGSWSYDDEISLSQSGSDLWISGLLQPIRTTRGSNDAVLVQQGKLKTNDSKLYIEGAINTSGTWRIGIGSPPSNEYAMAEAGVESWPAVGSPIYKLVYLTRITGTGSLAGE